ncbi:MAG: hypothetical protein LBP53_02125 [Candidatus Peribacteria bacterium]|nr:hypothetical protein [Candidatus Peribacteria bacterium]
MNKFYINYRLNHYQTSNLPLDNFLLIATCVVTDRAKNKWLKEVLKALKS